MDTPKSENKHILTIKCVVVGDERVGKSCFISRLSGHPFCSEYNQTMVNLVPVKTKRNGILMLVDCWDTPGAHHLDKIRFLAYQGTHIFAICFSVAIPESFENVRKRWVKEVRQHGPPSAELILIGLQSDLRGDENTNKELRARGVENPTLDQCIALAESIGAINYFECSAKSYMGLTNILEVIKDSIRDPNKIVRHSSLPFTESDSVNDVEEFKQVQKSLQRTSEP